MYVDADTVIKAATLITSVGILVGVVVAIYKIVENNRKQNAVIQQMQEEQTIICYGLKGALQGLIENGCNGPCKQALNLLDKHLNKQAHKPDL